MSVLQARELRKSFRQGGRTIEILRGLSFTAERGQTTAIVGKSGSGKSTLLALLAGLDSPDQGSVVLDGETITDLTEEQLAQARSRKIGIVFQQFHLMSHLTALENIRLPLEIAHAPDADSRARAIATQLGLGDRLTHFPHQLSGGEKQRVAIARAYVINPAVLLADEPSGNLDSETGSAIMNLLFESAKARGMTLILVTHDDSLAARCDRVLRLANGLLA